MGHPEFQNLWERTSKEPPPICNTLTQTIRTDVAIVGAGLTGLSAALHLAENRIETVVVDKHDPAWGASGRSGGQVQTTSGPALNKLIHGLEPQQQERVAEMAANGPDLVFHLIEKYAIACDPVRAGLLRGIHHKRLLPIADASDDHNSSANSVFADREKTAAMVGSDCFHGAFFDRRSGGINPCAYTRGLCRAAQAAGASVFRDSPAIKLRHDGSNWIVETISGLIVANRIVVATNAYSGGLVPRLQQTIVPVNSLQVATYPLQQNIAKTILPGGHVASDTRRLVFYFRKDADGRLVVGGRGPWQGTEDFHHYHMLRSWIQNTFPVIGKPDIQFYWSGQVGVTADGKPHVHEPRPGLHIVVGFNGKGMAMGTMLGKITAERILHDDPRRYGFAVRDISPYRFWHFRRAGVKLFSAWYRALDHFGR